MKICLPIFAALGGFLQAQIPTLEQGIDINLANNFQNFVLLDWESDGGLDLVGIDTVDSQLVRIALSAQEQRFTGPPVVIANIPPSISLQMGTPQLDAHPGEDLVLFNNGSALIWSSGARATSLDGAPDRTILLPEESDTLFGPREFADFDQDGKADLLLAGPSRDAHDFAFADKPGLVIFSFATEEAEVVSLPDLGLDGLSVETVSPWMDCGPLAIAITGGLANQRTRAIIEFGVDRTISQPASYPESTYYSNLANLDGDGGLERIIFENHTNPPTISVQTFDGSSWITSENVPNPSPFGTFPDQAKTADFDDDGCEEIIFLSTTLGINSENRRTLHLLSKDSSSETYRLIRLPDPFDEAFNLSVVEIPDSAPVDLPSLPPRYLSLFGPSLQITDLLGNPTSISGTGYISKLRFIPLNSINSREIRTEAHLIPTDLETSDFNNDGLPDLAILGSGKQVIFTPGTGLPPITPKAATPLDFDDASSVYLTDLNGDDVDDVILIEPNRIYWQATSISESGEISVAGETQVLSIAQDPDAPTKILADADFDMDGDFDLLILKGDDASIAWLENRDAGQTWIPHPIGNAGQVPRIDSGDGLGGFVGEQDDGWQDRSGTMILDVDDDGDPDFLSIPSALGNRLTLFRNTPFGFQLEPYSPPSSEFPEGKSHFEVPRGNIISGNFTGAGAELAILERDQMWLFGDGKTPMTPSVPINFPFLPFVHHVVTDFDADGIDDLVVAGTIGTDLLGNPSAFRDLFWLRNPGDGSDFVPVPLATPKGFSSKLLLADLDGDDLPDIISASNYTGHVEVFLYRNLAPIPPFADWIKQFSLTDPSAGSDSDHDSFSNIEEYARGSHPDDPSPDSLLNSPPETDPGLMYPSFSSFNFPEAGTYHRPRQVDGSSLRITLEVSPNLSDWPAVEVIPRVTIDPAFPLWETLYWPIPFPSLLEEPARFHRFRVELPEEP